MKKGGSIIDHSVCKHKHYANSMTLISFILYIRKLTK